MDLRDTLLSSYDYSLDPRRIAQFPAEPRDSAKLLIVRGTSKEPRSSKHAYVRNLLNQLIPGDLLILNDTRVLKARLKVRFSGGGRAELLLLEPRGNSCWLCLGRPAKRMRQGDHLWLEANGQKTIDLQVVSIDSSSGGRVVKFPSYCEDAKSIEGLLERYGEVPLPPYIESHDKSDDERYQTCYASQPGAVAAPTAGLHLTNELLNEFIFRGIRIGRITLHVGLGTFRPLENEDLKHLQLHSEWAEVGEEVVQAVKDCKLKGGRVIAVGTTSVRAIESAYLNGGCFLKPMKGKVDLVIKPGYRFGVVEGLLTNFHLPKSSLLLLVSALIGRQRLLALYAEAIERQYRFFSYGDAMWIPPEVVLPMARPHSDGD